MVELLVVVGVGVLVLLAVSFWVVLRCCPNPLDVMDVEHL